MPKTAGRPIGPSFNDEKSAGLGGSDTSAASAASSSFSGFTASRNQNNKSHKIPIVFKAIEVQTLEWVCRIIAEDGGSK
jgi:hypothetical protein